MKCPKGYSMSSNGVCQQTNGYRHGGIASERPRRPGSINPRPGVYAPQNPSNSDLRQPCADTCEDLMNAAFDCMGLHDWPQPGPYCSCTPVQVGQQEINIQVYDESCDCDVLETQIIPNFMYHCSYSGPSYASCFWACHHGSGGSTRQSGTGHGRSYGDYDSSGGHRRGGRIRRSRRR